MKCDNCGIRESTVTIRETINSQTRTYHLCEVCAAERGEQFALGVPRINFGFAVPRNILPSFSIVARPLSVSQKERLETAILTLKMKEKEAVDLERYKKAAEIRDRIEALKSEYRKELFREKAK